MSFVALSKPMLVLPLALYAVLAAKGAPYPHSQIVKEAQWQWETHKTAAPEIFNRHDSSILGRTTQACRNGSPGSLMFMARSNQSPGSAWEMSCSLRGFRSREFVIRTRGNTLRARRRIRPV